MKKKKKALKIIGVVCALLVLITIWLIGTKSGHKVVYKIAGNVIYSYVDNEEVIQEYHKPVDIDKDIKDTDVQSEINTNIILEARQDDDVTNYLIFGIEEIKGAKNTDSMMIASINTSDKSIKLTSLLRDTYVAIPGMESNKLNSAYSKGGAKMLVDTIEQNYMIDINGYASVNFEDFETIVDYLGGISIELGEKEAYYLNTTNYISKPEYRNVKAGINKLNGNQALGYCRVRGCETLGGTNDDYGRILRQQRVLDAIFTKYKSKGIFDFLKITKECLGHVTTNLSATQIQNTIEDIMENKIRTMDTFRVPVNGLFDDPKEYNGIGYPLILDWDENIKELYQYIYLDSEIEAVEALAKQKE